jgi:MFS family permease
MTSTDDSRLNEEQLYRKVIWRLLPVLMTGYVLAYLDRVNIGFAKLQMQSDLHLSDAVYGLGAGIFFIGYVLFEVPSNMVMAKVGAKLWISRIMITWGAISAATLFVNSETSFYALRFLLGVAEAGFFPGVILYLSQWFPAAYRARVTAYFYVAIALSSALGGPISGWIMVTMHGHSGLSGWQWLLLLEGIPSCLFGFFVLAYLDNSIAKAKWLSAAEKNVLQQRLDAENQAGPQATLAELLRWPRLWLFGVVNFSIQVGIYGVSFWLPQLIKNTGVKDLIMVGALSSIPWSIAAVGMVIICRSSDRSNERIKHLLACTIAGSAALAFLPSISSSTWPAMSALSIATLGILTALPLFWTIPAKFLTPASAAVGIAFINTIGSLGGFVAPYLVGYLRDATGSTAAGIYGLSAILIAGSMLAAFTARGLPARITAIGNSRPTAPQPVVSET